MMRINKPGTAVRKTFILIVRLSGVLANGSRAQSLDNPGSAQGMIIGSPRFQIGVSVVLRLQREVKSIRYPYETNPAIQLS